MEATSLVRADKIQIVSEGGRKTHWYVVGHDRTMCGVEVKNHPERWRTVPKPYLDAKCGHCSRMAFGA